MSLASIVRLASLAMAGGVLLAAPEARADSLRCEGGIVATGDSKLDLLGKCGPPALAEGATLEATLEAGGGVARRVVTPVEIWTYDLGRNRFIQVVRLEKGKIVSIERGSYGYADALRPPQRSKRATCAPAALAEGKLELDVLAACGEPAVVDTWQEEVATVHPAGDETVAAVAVRRTIQLFTYDLGPDHFVRYVQIEGGKVTRVETGSYGYAR